MADVDRDWDHSRQLAGAILRDRTARRKFMAALLVVVLGLMIGGNWPLAGWLSRNPWLFIAWWAACAVLTLVLLLFAVHDGLCVIREERAKMR